MSLIYLRSRLGFEDVLENQKRFSPAQREFAIEARGLAYFVVRRGSFSKAKRRQIFERDHGRCYHCDCQLNFDHFHVDHLRPVARGGGDEDENLVASCPPCNLRKGAN